MIIVFVPVADILNTLSDYQFLFSVLTELYTFQQFLVAKLPLREMNMAGENRAK